MQRRTVELGQGAAFRPRVVRRSARLSSASAFTLIELLIVIALSALLLALLFAPIIQGFKITNRTKEFVQAQDATRFGLENMEREIEEAAYIFDNTNTTISLPLEDPSTYSATNDKRTNGTALYSASTVPIAYGRLDLIPVDVNGGATGATDPTTGLPIGGATSRVPGAPASHRYVRYFVGLRNPTAYYGNVYVFPHSGLTADRTLNPFILYRAQYDPSDPTLINQVAHTSGGLSSNSTPDMGNDSGGFADPDFFYTGPYAAAWHAIASPVVTGNNLDLLIWQRGSNGQIDAGAPFRLATSFAPATVVGDTATPGFLSLANADAVGAVPTLYTAKNGQWTLPFTINIYRGVGTSQSGNLALHFAYPSGGGSLTVTANGSGSFANVGNPYCLYSESTGRYFVTIPGLVNGISFWVDPARGRIETGLPPISATNGSPQVYQYDSTGNLNTSSLLQLSTTGTVQTGYELATFIYRSTTLDVADSNQPVTDPTTGNTLYVPSNQGLLYADLRNPNGTGSGSFAGYYETTRIASRIDQIGAASQPSPFASFDGSILAPGTEHVVGPDNNVSTATTSGSSGGAYGGGSASVVPELFNYFRVGDTTDNGGVNTQPSKSTTGQLYNRSGPLNYRFDVNYKYTSYPKLDFGVPQIDYTLATGTTAYQTFLVKNGYAGLPAQPAGTSATPTTTAQSLAEIQVSFLWQNNFARDANGYPMSATGTIASAANGGAVSPEPDVFRLDYATRSLLNVTLGAEVYDSSGGSPQIAQVSDKVKINNVGQ